MDLRRPRRERGIAVGEREGRSFAPLPREHIRTGVGRRADPNERLGGSGP
jgi:hypothetical protein